jgi:aminoglycoside phosphotransferase (APT) family kinase protein
LRVAEKERDRLALDAEVLQQLRQQGVHVAEVVFVEPFDSVLSRSVPITTEVSGQSLAQAPSAEAARAVARAAGLDLALINQVDIQGFGFVRREQLSWPPMAEFSSYSGFLGSYLPDPWPGGLPSLFETSDLDVLERIIDTERSRPLMKGKLAHSDFDVTPIFQVDGRYTGLIDFGEMRGTEPLFDLGHFFLHDCEIYREPLIDDLVAG